MNTIPLAFMVSQLGASFATRNAARRLNKTDVIPVAKHVAFKALVTSFQTGMSGTQGWAF